MKNHVTFRLPKEWLALFEARLKKLGLTRSSYIRLLIEKDLKNTQRK